VFDESLVFKAELDFGNFLVAVASEGIDFAIEVELNPLLGFAGAKKPEGSGGEGENGGGAGDDLDPGFEGFEREFEVHSFASVDPPE
jgi:hypothetical protein